MDWDSMNFLLDDNWVWDFHGNLNWVWDFDFNDLFNFHNFVFRNFFVVMLVNSVNWNFDASNVVFPVKIIMLSEEYSLL